MIRSPGKRKGVPSLPGLEDLSISFILRIQITSDTVCRPCSIAGVAYHFIPIGSLPFGRKLGKPTKRRTKAYNAGKVCNRPRWLLLVSQNRSGWILWFWPQSSSLCDGTSLSWCCPCIDNLCSYQTGKRFLYAFA